MEQPKNPKKQENLFFYNTSIGRIALVANEVALTRLFFPCEISTAFEKGEFPDPYLVKETALLQRAATEIGEYFAGKRQFFDLPLAPVGTVFQQKVWQVLRSIPFGQVWSYGLVAAIAGCPKGARAVGLANNRNPIPIFIPCHRVVGATGKLVGFGGGLEVKKLLLALENADLTATKCPKDFESVQA